MCKFLSAVYTQDGRLFCDPEHTDSHSDLIAANGIKEREASGIAQKFVRLELTPGEGPDIPDADKWIERVDEHEVPAWFDAEARGKAFGQMRAIIAAMFIDGGERAMILGGCWILRGNTIIHKMVSAQVGVMGDTSQVGEMRGTSRVGAMWGTSRVGVMGDTSQVGEMRDTSQVGEMWGTSRVGVMGDTSQVGEMWDTSRVGVMGDTSQVGVMWNTSQVGEMWDTSRVGAMWGTSRVGVMGDTSQVGVMWDTSRVGAMWGTSRVGAMRNTSQVPEGKKPATDYREKREDANTSKAVKKTKKKGRKSGGAA